MSKNNAQQSNVVQQIEELKNKIQLLEGDTKAYYESSQFTIKKNTEKISKLRKENKELRKCQADKLSADEHVVCEGLKDHPTQKHALKGKPAPVAISIMDQKHCELLKKLNAERHVTAKKQKRLEQLKTKQDQMTKDAKDAVETDTGESDEAQTLRSLENRLDKAELKCKEAEHIQRTYMQIKEKLEKEHENHSNMLDDGENEIRRLKQEKKELETMQNDAVIARDAAKEELARLEKHLYEERKKREIELQQMKKEAEEKRIQQEKIMTRIATQTGMQSGEEVSAEQHLAIQEEEEQRRISSYEDVFRRIKDATGVSETKDVIWRFENQDETTRHLEELKATNEVEIARLREDKDKLQKDFEEMKYSGEAKMSSGQRMLEECEMHVAAEEKRMDISKDRLDKSSRVLTDAKSGIEHLTKKLFAIKTQSSQVQKSKISPTSDEFVLDQLSISEEKLLKLLEELEQSGKDVDELSRLIEEEDFHNTVDQNLPKHNVRVKLPTTKTEAYIGDEESGDDDEILSREGLKKQSQQIVDAKTRRRPGKKKKGK